MKRKWIILYIAILLATCLSFFFTSRRNDSTVMKGEANLWLGGPEGSFSQPAKFTPWWRSTSFESKPVNLGRGRYTLELEYLADEVGNTIELTSPTTGGVNNEYMLSLGSFELPVSESMTTIRFDFTLEENVKNFSFHIHHAGGELYVPTYKVSTNDLIYADALFVPLITLAAGLAGLFWAMRAQRRGTLASALSSKEVSYWQGLFICLAAALFITLPLFRPHIMHQHDLWFHASRIESIADGILQGHFPVRINTAMANGMGDISNVMYPSLFLYIPALLRLCGVSLLTAYQFFLLLVNLATAALCYHAMHRLLRAPLPAMLVGVLYTLNLYRIVNLFVRAALGELLAAVFLPCIILGVYDIFWREKPRAFWLAVGFFGVLNSHVLSTLICAVACLAYGLFHLRRLNWTRIFAVGRAMVAVLALSAWWLVPFLYYSRLDLLMYHVTEDLAEQAIMPGRVFATFIQNDSNDRAMYTRTVGGILALGALIFLVGQYWIRRPFAQEDERYSKIGKSTLIGGSLFLFGASSLFPWNALRDIPVLSQALDTLQFPWRLLAFAAVLLCVTAALALYRYHKPGVNGRQLAVIGVVLAVLSVVPYYDTIDKAPAADVTDKYSTAYYSYHNYENLYLNYDSIRQNYGGDHNAHISQLMQTPLNIGAADGVEITNYHRQGPAVSFDYSLDASIAGENVVVRVPLYYYPGYHLLDENNNLIGFGIDENNLINVSLPTQNASGSIRVFYREPWHFIAGNGITVAGVLALGAWALWRRRKGAVTAART